MRDGLGHGQGPENDKGAPADEAETGSEAAEMVALQSRHAEIERRLSELSRHPSQTTAEQLEWSRLKKEKLAGKDRLALLRARTGHAAVAGSRAARRG